MSNRRGGSRLVPGPQPKGDRRQFTMRVPNDHWVVYEQRARLAGLSSADYIAAALAQAHGLAVPSYVVERLGQDELPFAS